MVVMRLDIFKGDGRRQLNCYLINARVRNNFKLFFKRILSEEKITQRLMTVNKELEITELGLPLGREKKGGIIFRLIPKECH